MSQPTHEKYALVIDPGLLTGMVFADIEDLDNPKPIWACEYGTRDFYQLSEETIVKYYDNIIVICENYIINKETWKKTQAPWSLMGRGMLEFNCMKYDVPFVLQTPGDMKDFSTHDKIRRVGFWYKGGEGHANDAYGHLLLYIVRIHPKFAKKLLV